MIATRLPTLIDELRTVVGVEGVLSAHSDLVVYECDGFVIEKNCPDVAVFPRTTAQVQADRPAVQRVRRALFAARGRHQSGGRLPAGRRRRDDRADADEGDPGNQSARSVCGRAAGRGQRLADAGPQRDRLPLRPRSIEPGSLHDRRQCGHQLGRTAHAQVRRHRQPRAGGRSRAGRRLDRPIWRPDRRSTQAWT